ncbi:hypothetical protein N9Z02_00435 [Akkermansiaceae bacterium]|nr:hypothetical protein [Akkermansiaceae bacterium]
MPRWISLLLILPFLSLVSCIEGEEEIWLNWDASGKIRAHYEFPPAMRASFGDLSLIVKAIKDLDEREKGIEVQEIQFEQDGPKLIFHLEATFDNATELMEVSERNLDIIVNDTGMPPEQSEAMAGDITFEIEGFDAFFDREVNLSALFPEMVKRNPQLLGKSNFRYKINLPFPVESSNAHAVTNEGKSLEWIFLLKEHTQDPLSMSLKAKLSIPWWIWAIAGLLILIVAGLIWRKFLRR